MYPHAPIVTNAIILRVAGNEGSMTLRAVVLDRWSTAGPAYRVLRLPLRRLPHMYSAKVLIPAFLSFAVCAVACTAMKDDENPGQTAAGVAGGISHFGFRLRRPEDIDLAVQEVLAAGGRLLRRGEFAPGYPYAYVADPDGYEIEIWFE